MVLSLLALALSAQDSVGSSFAGQWNDAKALALAYGNYDSKSRTVRGEYSHGKATPFSLLESSEWSGGGKTYRLVFTIGDSGMDHIESGCYGCMRILGGAVFEREIWPNHGPVWVLIHLARQIDTDSFGDGPKGRIVTMGDAAPALRTSVASISFGTLTESAVIFAFVNGKFQKVCRTETQFLRPKSDFGKEETRITTLGFDHASHQGVFDLVINGPQPNTVAVYEWDGKRYLHAVTRQPLYRP